MKSVGWRTKGIVLGAVLATAACATVRDLTGNPVEPEMKDPTCKVLNPESGMHLVRICESFDDYVFNIAGRKYTYKKPIFRAMLRKHLYFFMRQTQYRWRTLESSRIEVWVNAPAFKPLDTHLSVVVIAGAGNFLVHLPLEVDRWHIDQENLFALGANRYPTRKSNRVGIVAVESRSHISKSQWQHFLSEIGFEPSGVAGSVTLLRTRMFDERSVAERLLQHPAAGYFVRDVRRVPSGEQDGRKVLGFSFGFDG